MWSVYCLGAVRDVLFSVYFKNAYGSTDCLSPTLNCWALWPNNSFTLVRSSWFSLFTSSALRGCHTFFVLLLSARSRFCSQQALYVSTPPTRTSFSTRLQSIVFPLDRCKCDQQRKWKCFRPVKPTRLNCSVNLLLEVLHSIGTDATLDFWHFFFIFFSRSRCSVSVCRFQSQSQLKPSALSFFLSSSAFVSVEPQRHPSVSRCAVWRLYWRKYP